MSTTLEVLIYLAVLAFVVLVFCRLDRIPTPQPDDLPVLPLEPWRNGARK